MSKITVGRANDCDIVIVDETDNVSRHHLVISFDILGRMKVSDTSSNGTFINGVRMLKGASISVTPKDEIRLGRNEILDWKMVKDPNTALRWIIMAVFVVAVLAGVGFGVWNWYEERRQSKENPTEELVAPDIKTDDAWTKDSTEKVAPTVTSINVKGEDKKSSANSPVRKKEHKENVYDKKKAYDKEDQKKIVIRKDHVKEKDGMDSLAVF